MKTWWRKGLFLGALGLLFLTGCSEKYPLLDPQGPVARKEYHMLLLTTILTGIVIVPVVILLFVVAFRYRDKPNRKAAYKPDWHESKWLEIIWWGIPVIIILIIATVTVKETFALQYPPEKKEPITVEVTSLDWKWLFTYPEQGIATVNYMNIPTDRPVKFVLTSDAPINAFWIPSLGGMQYTMPGMAMRLWSQADEPGTYIGKGANFSGKHFANMSFKVNAQSQEDFDKWVEEIKKSKPALTNEDYAELSKQSVVGESAYSSYPKDLYMNILMKNGGEYMPNHWMMMENQKTAQPTK